MQREVVVLGDIVKRHYCSINNTKTPWNLSMFVLHKAMHGDFECCNKEDIAICMSKAEVVQNKV
jgi:hypothetical protein